MQRHISIVGIALLAALLVSGCGSAAAPTQPARTQPPAATSMPIAPSATAVVQSPADCPITPIYTNPYSGPDSNTAPAALPWVQAEPTSSGITGHLFYAIDSQHYFLHAGGQFPDGTADKILWLITNPQATNQLAIKGTMLSNPQETFDEVFPAAVSPPNNYPSIIDAPTAGCWQLTLTSGAVTGTLIVWVVNT
jgi:hypothetical protein